MSVQNLAFHQTPEPESVPLSLVERTQKSLKDYSTVVRYGALMVGLALVLLFVVRPMQKRVLAEPEALAATLALTTAAESPDGEAEVAPAEGDLALNSLLIKKQLADFVKKEPESSATAVRAWLREEAL